ncbi:porin [Iodobacter sp. CM08]|uniref:porin n=1 Tax=Iodobacter sp. CM08 TaxID=3085902 RepID=UPI0029816725|nr:porin [Iodobacter sp. CM08]MDW5415521.1 porin [Iodobacter sp. CM08]
MKKNILASLILSTLIASPAFAEGFYIGADVGSSNMSVDVNNNSLDKNNTAWGINGGYKFSPYLAAELGYRDFGKAEENYYGLANASVKANAVQASVLASYPFNDAFSVFGRLGVASIKVTAEINADVLAYSKSNEKTETKALFGIGAQYAFNKNFSLRAEYNQYAKIENLKLSTFTVGANYSF